MFKIETDFMQNYVFLCYVFFGKNKFAKVFFVFKVFFLKQKVSNIFFMNSISQDKSILRFPRTLFEKVQKKMAFFEGCQKPSSKLVLHGNDFFFKHAYIWYRMYFCRIILSAMMLNPVSNKIIILLLKNYGQCAVAGLNRGIRAIASQCDPGEWGFG